MKTEDEPVLDLRYSLPVSALGLSNRTLNALLNDDMQFVGQLVEHSAKSLLNVPNLGRKGLMEVKTALESRGLGFDTVIFRKPDDYTDFMARLAIYKQEALRADATSRASATPIVKNFKEAAIIADVLEHLSDPRFKRDLTALVRRYKPGAPADPR